MTMSREAESMSLVLLDRVALKRMLLTRWMFKLKFISFSLSVDGG
jgi:hypothetical protein